MRKSTKIRRLLKNSKWTSRINSKAKADKPNLVPQNPTLYSADQWLANVGGSDIEIHKENTKAKKKVNAAKVASVVDRLSKPSDKNKLRKDPKIN